MLLNARYIKETSAFETLRETVPVVSLRLYNQLKTVRKT